MKTSLKGIEKRACFYLFFSILLFCSCGAPEDYAIPPINQDSILQKIRKPDTTIQTAEKKKPLIYSIEIKNMAFNPAAIKVPRGAIVVWNNQDLVAHCVSEDPGKHWTSMEIQPGSTWQMVVTKTTNYYCAIHQVMKGRIVVE